MNNLPTSNPLDQKVTAPTVDEIINARFNDVAQAFNEQFEKMYLDFNLTLEKMNKDVNRVEMSFASSVNILFGLLNDQKLQFTSLLEVMKKNGLSLEELEDEYERQKTILEESGEFKRHSLDEVLGSRIDHKNQDEPGLIR